MKTIVVEGKFESGYVTAWGVDISLIPIGKSTDVDGNVSKNFDGKTIRITIETVEDDVTKHQQKREVKE